MRGRVRKGARGALACALLALASVATERTVLGQTAPAVTPREERVEDLPPGAGREETFGLCAACHAYRLVSIQGLSRDRWDETLTWMTQRHNMPDLQGDDRELILNYLASAHPPRTSPAAGGFRNPFATQ